MIGSGELRELYRCPAEPDRWRSVLDWVCREMEVSSAVVQRLRQSGDRIEQTWVVRDSASTRDAAVHDRLVNNASNPRMNMRIVRPYPRDGIIRDRDVFAPGCPHLAELRQRLRTAGLGESLGAGVQRGAAEATVLILHRHRDDARPFTQGHERFLLSLLPHIDNASDLSWRLDRQGDQSRQIEAIADALSVGIVMCDEGRQVRWANEAAQEILSTSPYMSMRSGRLHMRNACEDRLARLLTGVGRDASEPFVLGAGADDEVHLALLPRAASLDGFALLMSQPRRAMTASIEDIAKLLQVTRAEARVTAALCAGSTLKEYALSRGISEGSARNQLKQVLAKTGARRQSELVRHLCSSVIFQAKQQPSACHPEHCTGAEFAPPIPFGT